MKIYKTKPCKRCGNLFTPTSPCNTYCSTDCRGKNAYYIRNYGITQDDLEAMKTEQGHNCLTCGGPGFLIGNNGHSERLVVDHCHNTGLVRGLLCHNCNRALGLLKDDPALMRRLADYVEVNRQGATTIPEGSRAKWSEAHSPS